MCAPIAMLHASKPEEAEEFAYRLFTLENLKAKSPVMVFYKWYQNHWQKANNSKLQCMKVVSSALYNFCNKKEIAKIYSNNEAYEWLLDLEKNRVKKVREIIGT